MAQPMMNERIAYSTKLYRRHCARAMLGSRCIVGKHIIRYTPAKTTTPPLTTLSGRFVFCHFTAYSSEAIVDSTCFSWSFQPQASYANLLLCSQSCPMAYSRARSEERPNATSHGTLLALLVAEPHHHSSLLLSFSILPG